METNLTQETYKQPGIPEEHNSTSGVIISAPKTGADMKVEADPNIISSGKGDNLKRDVVGSQEEPKDTCAGPVMGQIYSRPARDILPVQDYFRKPMLIGVLSWTTATAIQVIDPYTLWEGITAVKSRFSYYNKRSYNLKIAVSINGSPYHVGAAIMDWNPCTRGTTPAALPYIGTQRRHFILQPDIASYEMSIPHWADPPYIIGSAATVISRGKLSFTPIAALSRVDGVAPGTITVMIRAWTEDMAQSEPSYVNTSGPVRSAIDFGKSLVSIGGTVMDGVDWLAKLLGFTVASDTSTRAMIPATVGNFANTSGSRPMDVLNTDVHNMIPFRATCNELSDELTFASMSSRRAMMAVYSFTTVLAQDAILATIPVHPLLSYNGTGCKGISPMGLCALNFGEWVGSIVFTVTIYSSPLQQGALLITHEPANVGTINTLNIPNAAATNRSCILDIAKSKQMSFIVSSCGATSEALICVPARTGTTVPADPLIDIGGSAIVNRTAGRLVIAVNKPLISPGASSCIVTVSIEAGPDFELIGYQGEAVAAFTYTSLAVTSAVAAPKVSDCDLRIHNFPTPISAYHSGERVISFRPLLQRPNYNGTGTLVLKNPQTITPTLNTQIWGSQSIAMHNFKGYAGAYSTVARTSTNLDLNDTFNMVSACFARRSGGLRYWMFNSYRSTSNAPQFASLSLSEANATNNLLFCNGSFAQNGAAPAAAGGLWTESDLLANFWFYNNGTTLTDLRHNAVLSAEFTPCTTSVYLQDTTSLVFNFLFRDMYSIDYQYHTFRSAKPDIQFYEFVGVPGVNYNLPTSIVIPDSGNDGNIYS